jgi:hypothetical protein
MEWYRLTAEVEAILLGDYSMEDGTELLPIGTLFRVCADEGTVLEHPGVVFNVIVANGRRYRVEAATLVGKHEKFDAPKEE